eukprot:4028102-Amphidinium_carterae.3
MVGTLPLVQGESLIHFDHDPLIQEAEAHRLPVGCFARARSARDCTDSQSVCSLAGKQQQHTQRMVLAHRTTAPVRPD